MKKSCFLICCMLFGSTAQATTAWTISSRGLGAIHAGMTIEHAAQRLGSTLRTHDGKPPQPSCDFLYPSNGKKGIAFMVSEGKINHAAISTPNIATKSGAKVGDTTARLKTLFGDQLEIAPHEYGDGDFYYFIWEKNRQYGVKFEIVQDKVVEIYAGDTSIQFVEGCA